MNTIENQLDFFELLMSPLEKAKTYEEIMKALNDICIGCRFDNMGICCCENQCILGNQKVERK